MTEEESHPSIVVVDDSAEDLSLVGRLLRQCNLMNPVVALASGAECIKWLKANSSRLPVLVLMDLIMYPTSGLDVLKAMKQMGILDAVPVIMLSGIRDVKVIHEGYQLGAKTFLI
ncbi:MAG TPA: response regulator, partial [Verrucomicrobiae bacterium]|nr:response regulator [Verrucomicrobiae bacterium]